VLAGVFGDGAIRVLDIRSEWIGNADKVVNIRIEHPAWEQTCQEIGLATCVAWKSHAEIVVGYSNGYCSFSQTHIQDMLLFSMSKTDRKIVILSSCKV